MRQAVNHQQFVQWQCENTNIYHRATVTVNRLSVGLRGQTWHLDFLLWHQHDIKSTWTHYVGTGVFPAPVVIEDGRWDAMLQAWFTQNIIKGQLCWFSTLCLSIWIRNMMWNRTIFFFNILCLSACSSKTSCSSWNQWCHWFQENYKLFAHRLSPRTPGKPPPFVLRGFSDFGD